MNQAATGVINWKGPHHVWDGMERDGFHVPALYLQHVQSTCADIGFATGARDALAEFCILFLAEGAQLPGIRMMHPCVVSWINNARHTPELRAKIEAEIEREATDKRVQDYDIDAPLDEMLDKIAQCSMFEVGEVLQLSMAGYCLALPWGGKVWMLPEKRRLHLFKPLGTALPITFLLQSNRDFLPLNWKFVVPGVDHYLRPETARGALLSLLALVRAGELLAESLAAETIAPRGR